MKTDRHRSGSKRLDLYPLEQSCPNCHQVLVERYRKQRWIVQLHQQLKVISHCLSCPNPVCSLHQVIYRPAEEGALALRGYKYLGSEIYKTNWPHSGGFSGFSL